MILRNVPGKQPGTERITDTSVLLTTLTPAFLASCSFYTKGTRRAPFLQSHVQDTWHLGNSSLTTRFLNRAATEVGPTVPSSPETRLSRGSRAEASLVLTVDAAPQKGSSPYVACSQATAARTAQARSPEGRAGAAVLQAPASCGPGGPHAHHGTTTRAGRPGRQASALGPHISSSPRQALLQLPPQRPP